MTSWVSQTGAGPVDTETITPEETLACYGRERLAQGPLIALQLRFLNGNATTLEYAHRLRADFDPSSGITMSFTTGLQLTIEGQNLRTLFDDLTMNRVLWIRELDRFQGSVKNEARVSRIGLYDLQGNGRSS